MALLAVDAAAGVDSLITWASLANETDRCSELGLGESLWIDRIAEARGVCGFVTESFVGRLLRTWLNESRRPIEFGLLITGVIGFFDMLFLEELLLPLVTEGVSGNDAGFCLGGLLVIPDSIWPGCGPCRVLAWISWFALVEPLFFA